MTQVPVPAPLSLPTSGGAAATSGLIGFIERWPERAFAAFLALHVIVWTTLPTLLYANLPLDLIEALTYGREWQLGYDKLPPLPWWLVEIMYRTFGSDVAYYALAQVAVIVAFIAVWATARPLVGARGALVAVLIIDGMHYLQYTAVKFNHDVIQLPFWALSGYAFHAALKRGRLCHWLLFGFCIGAALWAKYFVVVLAVPYALFLLLDREARRAVATPGPWIAVVVAFIVMAPHLWWLVQTDFLPLAYAEHRATPVRGWFDHLLHPALFAGSQFFFLLPSFFIAAALLWPRPRKTPLSHRVGAGARRHTGLVESGLSSDDAVLTPTDPASPPALASRRLPEDATDANADAFDRRIVMLLAFGPGLTTIALGAISGRGAVAMWGYPLWLFLGLWIVLNARSVLNRDRLGRVVAAWGTVFVVFALAFVINYSLLPRFDHRYRAVFFPGDKLAVSLTQRFHAASGQRLRYVIGSMWDGGNIAHYSPDHPRVLIDGLPGRAPWIDLSDLRANGAVVVWTVGDSAHLPPQYAAVAGDATVGTPFDLPPRRGDGITHVGWAILKPQPHAAVPDGANGK
jgi:4-amino-4-deoxy-L-arabinose transferase-like glycosyltransferase